MRKSVEPPRNWRVELIGAYYFRAPETPVESRRLDPPATLIVMHAGRYRAHTGLKRDAPVIEAQAGDVVYWPRGMNRVELNDVSHPTRCVVCQFLWLNPLEGFPQIVHDQDHLLAQLGNHLVALHGEPSGLPAEVANGYLSAMLSEYSRLAQMNLPPLVLLVSRYTEENLRQPFLLKDMAAAIQLNASHLVRQFRRLTGMTPMDFVRRRRVERAVGMLLNDPKTDLKEIARRVGLKNAPTLSRLIKRYTRMTTREIRGRRSRHPSPASPFPLVLGRRHRKTTDDHS